MTATRFNSPLAIIAKVFCAMAAIVAVVASPALKAAGAPPGSPVPVIYSPDTAQSAQGTAPFTYNYDLTVTSPSSLPAGTTTITMSLGVIASPAGSDNATALSYVTFSAPVLTFTGPNQMKTTTVRLAIPAGSANGDFAYLITTSGWPTGYNITDNGTRINAHVNPPSGLEPPVVTISSPDDGTNYTHTIGAPAIMVPITVTGGATNSAPVTALTATITGYSNDNTVILPTTALNLVLTGLGTANTQGSVFGGFPVLLPGSYTVSATATNSEGQSVTSVDFTVDEIAPPPTVEILAPVTDYSYLKGVTAATVPYSIKATSLQGGIITLQATLDGDPIVITNLAGVSTDGVTPGQLVATGLGNWVFSTSAILGGTTEHTLVVTATDPQGSATATTKFKVTELLPSITTTIAPPLDGSVIPMPFDASNLIVPVVFTSTASPTGATVKTVSATLDGSPMTVTPTTLDRPSVTATASLSFPSGLDLGGTHTIVATGANAGLNLSAIDDATFTITPPPPPTIAFTQSPLASYTSLLGNTLSIPFTFKTSNTGAYIKNQSATLDGIPVLITDSANSGSLTATGGGVLSILTSLITTVGIPDQHELVVTGTDVYGQTVSTSAKFTVSTSSPVINIAINPQIVANSPYTLPTSGSLSIPFTFTGTITAGSTVDTITGSLGANSPVTISSTNGLGTSALATASGNLIITAPGTYTVTATDTNNAANVSATTSVTFVVKQAQIIPPLTVAITQAPAATYTITSGTCGGGLCIPITFVGTSNGGKVQTMTATLDGKAISLSSLSGIGYGTATGKANLSVSTAGTHVLVVKDTDNYGQTATATTTFNVVVQNPQITTTITAPSNGAVYYLTSSGCGSTPICIPYSFTSTITGGATIDRLSATLNGCSLTLGSKTGIGTSTATGSGTLSICQVGTYTLRGTGTDTDCGGLSASDSVTFTVVKASPPTVCITAPTSCSYTYITGGSAVSVPFTFVGKSISSKITKLSATLNGNAVSVTSSGLNTATATGTGTLSFTTAGSYILSVSAVDAIGTATAKTTICITVKCPTPTVDFTTPSDCATYTYTRGDAVPTIPYSFTAKTSSGATISSVKATLGCNNLTVSATGLGTQTTIGTGTAVVSGPGTYTITATAVSGGVTVTDKVTFTVVMKEPVKTCSVTWLPPVSAGQAQKGNCYVPVKFQVQSKYSVYGSTRCDNLRDTSVKICVYEVYSNGKCGPAKVYSSCDYSIDNYGNYTVNHWAPWGTHTYRTEVYCFPNGG
ncbi:MAG: hypothetical protein JSS11_15180, partial [Verrucomicrobia bacterium]|nr:hypothetical protein [Verrucomicrobiota bacterium]